MEDFLTSASNRMESGTEFISPFETMVGIDVILNYFY